jgi:hypothetical protein
MFVEMHCHTEESTCSKITINELIQTAKQFQIQANVVVVEKRHRIEHRKKESNFVSLDSKKFAVCLYCGRIHKNYQVAPEAIGIKRIVMKKQPKS